MSLASVPLVRYAVSLRVPAWGERPAALLDEDAWHVRAIELHEALDRPYALELTLVTEDLDLDLDPIVGAPLTLSCRRDDEHERLVHGVVEQAWYLGTFGDRLHLRLRVGPALGRLGLSRRSRVFQDMTVVQIARAVVAEAFEPLGRSLDASRLLRSYDARDYCVQLRETDLEFLTRILAEEGIGFLFEHGESAEAMVLFDDPRALQAIGADGSGGGGEGDSAAPAIAVSTSQADRAGTETITRFEWRRQARPHRVERSAWDWQPWQPDRNVGRAEDEEPPPWAFGEHYEHGRRRLVEGLDHTPRAASDAHEGLEARSQAALGQGNVLSFLPGHTFELEGHPLSALDRSYALVGVIHRADCPEADIDDPGRFAGPNYENRFECVPAGVVWRPRVPDKPRVFGHMLATVVGPPGEEIHTDEHGRIKAWIHWDREHEPGDADASCWLRVAQAWAGPGFGTMFIPRVGMEILVSFGDGDPDQPLCVGCVYQGHNRPPYPLPAERTKSTIKSRSTPGSGDQTPGGNELRFEDAAGSEQVYLHAQRDLDEVIGRNHDRRVGADETIAVDNDRRLEVSGSQTVTIEGNHRVVVKGASPKGLPLPPPNYAIEVQRELSIDASERVTMRAPVSITLSVQGTSLTLTPQGLVLQAGSGASTSIDAGVLLRSSPGATLGLDASGGLAMAAMAAGGAPGASLGLDATAALGSQAGAGLTLGDDVTLHAPSIASAPGASLTLDTSAAVSGHAITLQAQAAKATLDANATVEGMEVTLRGATAVTCEGTKTSLRGQQVTAEAMALLTIGAPLVKIN